MARGVHQGYPLSTLLYIIAAKVLAIFIDADTRIKGLLTGDHEMKIKMKILVITPPFSEEILTASLEYNRFYEKASSSKINFPKIQAL